MDDGGASSKSYARCTGLLSLHGASTGPQRRLFAGAVADMHNAPRAKGVPDKPAAAQSKSPCEMEGGEKVRK